MTHPTVAAAGQSLALATPDILREDRPDGSFVLTSREPLGEYARCINDWLVQWAEARPDTVFLAERAGPDRWRTVTYAQALQQVRRLAQGLLDIGVSAQHPVVAVSDNSVNLALLSLAAMHARAAVAVVSSSYIRMAKEYDKIHGILQRFEPGAVYAEDGEVYGKALSSAGLACPLIYTRNVPEGGKAIEQFEREPTARVDEQFAAIQPDDTAKFLLTSGSTGNPKVVVNTHRMLCANQQMIIQVWPFIRDAAPVVLDWLPWSHTFGANHNFNLVLRNGGSLYIDDGRPVPGPMAERTVANLRELKPSLYFNVPRGYDVLLPYFDEDPELARGFFENLDVLFYAGAALPASTWQRLEAAAKPWRNGRRLYLTTSWGATETSPLITSAHFYLDGAGNIGVPVPGMSVKFVPAQGKWELRVRGVSVFSQYRNDPERTAAAFDDEGFYCLGDAGRLVDDNNPSAGILFDGRVAEDFKLVTGTWVSVGTTRLRAVTALAPLAQDVVITGHDRDEIGLLVFPSLALRELADDPEGKLDGDALAAHPAVREKIATAMRDAYAGAGSSQRPARALLLTAPPSLDDGEITDKGYINQRAVLENRGEEVARLYSDDAAVIRPAG